MMSYSTYILAFGAHPDDVEVGAGGIIAQTSDEGRRNIIIDLTPSQMSTHGDPDQRCAESRHAADILGVGERINLGLDDTMLADTFATRALLALHIRTYRPEIVVLPYTEDRHPDHEMTAQLVKQGLFLAGLSKHTADGLSPHKPRLVLHYQIWHELSPDVIVPLSADMFNKKMAAFGAYRSQHQTNGRGVSYLEARHITQGRSIGAAYGEGFMLSCHRVGVTHLDYLQSGFF